jgi:hypothetical protein
VKNRKTATRGEGGVEWETQISFETFDRRPKIKPQEANIDTVITTTLEKGGCSLGTQRITTKQAEQRTGEHQTKRQENETLHFYREEARSQISDTQDNR